MILSIPNQALGMYCRVIPQWLDMAGFGFAQSENETMSLYDTAWAGKYRRAIRLLRASFVGSC